MNADVMILIFYCAEAVVVSLTMGLLIARSARDDRKGGVVPNAQSRRVAPCVASSKLSSIKTDQGVTAERFRRSPS